MSSANLKAITTGQAAPEQPQRTPYEQLKRQLEASKAEFMPLLGGSQANVDAFVRVVLNAVMANPDLLAADRRSLIAGCMKAAQDGLMPDGREAVLNIYSVKVKEGGAERWVQHVQYLPMVGGLIKNLYASGEITSLDAAAVYANDRFLFRRGDDPKLDHEPTMADDPGQLVCAYVVVRLKNGDIKREVMPRRDIEAVRAVSKSGNGASSPWVKWYDQQAIKSVIKRAYKQLPKSEKFEAADRADNEELGFAGTPQSMADIAVRHSTATPPAPRQALAHTAPDTLDFGTQGAGARQPVHVDRDERDDAEGQQGTATRPEPKPEARPQARPPAFDVEAFRARMEGCTDVDALNLLADDIRDIPDAHARVALNAAYDRRLDALQNPPPATQAAQPTQRRTRAINSPE